MNEMTDIYRSLARKLRGEGDDTIRDGDGVRVPLMLTDAAPFRRMTDAAIRRDRATRDAMLTMDAAAHRPGNFFMRSQAHLTDSERQDLLNARAQPTETMIMSAPVFSDFSLRAAKARILRTAAHNFKDGPS